MKLEIPEELLIEGVARGVERGLINNPELVNRLTSAICMQFEVLNAKQAAGLLGVTARTLEVNRKKWGLNRSVALGFSNPRYLLHEVIEAVKNRTLKANPLKATK